MAGLQPGARPSTRALDRDIRRVVRARKLSRPRRRAAEAQPVHPASNRVREVGTSSMAVKRPAAACHSDRLARLNG